MRNSYNDKIFDINSSEDLDNKLSFDVLAKTDQHLLFEYGLDFFKLDRQTNEMTQYPDFVSLKENEGGKIVNSDEISVKYAQTLINAITQNKQLDKLENFDLIDRTSYIKESIKDFQYSFYSKNDLRQKAHQKREIDQSLESSLSSIDTKETKALTDPLKATISVLSAFLIFFKPIKIEKEKTRLIKEIKDQLDNKEINVRDVYSNKELMQKVPELKQLLDKYKEKEIQGTIDHSINEILKDPDVIAVADKLSTEHRGELSNTLYDNITNSFNEKHGDIESIIRDAHEESGLEINDFIQDRIVFNMTNILKEVPDASSNDFALYSGYLHSVLEPSSKDKLAACMNDSEDNFKLGNLTDIMEITLEEDLKMTNQKKL